MYSGLDTDIRLCRHESFRGAITGLCTGPDGYPSIDAGLESSKKF